MSRAVNRLLSKPRICGSARSMSESARIATLPNLPLFHRLAGRKAVVVGTSEGARWKAELLAAGGADLLHLESGWEPAQLEGVAIAVADLADRDEALRFAAAARAAGAMVNIVDQTDLCDVIFGTIVNRAPVVIAISTDGAAPVLAQSIRTRIESILPPELSAWASAAKAWRPRLKQRIADFAGRRAFWGRFADQAWRSIDREPVEDDFEALLADAPEAGGSVTIIHADPVDPGLLTLKAVQALQRATIILHDEPIGPQVLEIARREAKRVALAGDDERHMADLAAAGENVVRLKAGAPGAPALIGPRI